MGANSHNHTINENAKPFSKATTYDQYDISVGRRCPKCRKLYKEIESPEGNRCRHKGKK